MKVIYHRKFKKALQKQPIKTQKKFIKCLHLFVTDQYHYSLNNHQLQGEYKGLRSLNVTGDVRAIYEVVGETVYFIKIGTHSELY
jgi:mRNA interferase YafQ